MNTNSFYRSSARESLKGHWNNAALLVLFFLIICNIAQILNYFAIRLDMPQVLGGLSGVYSFFIVLPAAFSFFVVFLRLVRNPETNLTHSFFSYFGNNYNKALFSMLLLYIIVVCFVTAGILFSVAIASIPFSLIDTDLDIIGFTELHSRYALFKLFQSFSMVLYVIICGFIFCLTIIPMLMYLYKISLFPFIIEERPDSGIVEAYQLSKRLMYGHRKQLFLLDLSFIGWYLLSIPTFGIALLWVIPYQQTARAHFYKELKEGYDRTYYLSVE